VYVSGKRESARAALRQSMIASIFIILQQIPVATIDAGKDPGTLQRWCLVQPIQVQVRGVRRSWRCIRIILVGFDVEAFATRQRRLVRPFRFRWRLECTVRRHRVHSGWRLQRVLDRYVDHAAVLLAQLAGRAVSTDIGVNGVMSSGLRCRLRASRLPAGVQIPR